jgi:hypothetical protein
MGRSRYLPSAPIPPIDTKLTINQIVPVELGLTTNLSTESSIDQRTKTKSIGRCIPIISSDVIDSPLRGFVLWSILLVMLRKSGVWVVSLVERLSVGLELRWEDSERCHGDVGTGTDLRMDHHPVVEPGVVSTSCTVV